MKQGTTFYFNHMPTIICKVHSIDGNDIQVSWANGQRIVYGTINKKGIKQMGWLSFAPYTIIS